MIPLLVPKPELAGLGFVTGVTMVTRTRTRAGTGTDTRAVYPDPCQCLLTNNVSKANLSSWFEIGLDVHSTTLPSAPFVMQHSVASLILIITGISIHMSSGSATPTPAWPLVFLHDALLILKGMLQLRVDDVIYSIRIDFLFSNYLDLLP